MSTRGNCPICSNPIGENETLLSYYYPAKDWWVVAHVRRNARQGLTIGGNMELENASTICHKAGFEPPRHIGDSGPG